MRFILFISTFFLLLTFFPAPASAAQLSLKTASNSLKENTSGQIDIFLTGGEETLGTDVILYYDPKMIDLIAVKESSLYPTYQPPIAKRIDRQKGKITLSGSANLNKMIKADGVFASLLFKPIKNGQSRIYFDYDKSSTDKTGVIDVSGNNLLISGPPELKLTIQSDSFIDGILNPFRILLAKILGRK